MTAPENLMWLVVLLSIWGTILNARQNIYCFPIWILSNVCWIVYGVYKSAPAMAGMFVVYTIISIYGWIYWKKTGPQK